MFLRYIYLFIQTCCIAPQKVSSLKDNSPASVKENTSSTEAVMAGIQPTVDVLV